MSFGPSTESRIPMIVLARLMVVARCCAYGGLLHAQGAALHAWSSSGADHADSSAELGLADCFVAYLPNG